MKTSRVHFETRYLVLNTAATTTELEHAQLLAIAAIVVEDGVLRSRDSFYLSLNDKPSAQISAAMRKLLELSANSVLVTFNAALNRSLIEDACSQFLGERTPWKKDQRWLDLYFLLPALFPEHHERPARLQSWMKSFAIEPIDGEPALADAWAIAQLLLAVQARGSAMGAHNARALINIERIRRQTHNRI